MLRKTARPGIARSPVRASVQGARSRLAASRTLRRTPDGAAPEPGAGGPDYLDLVAAADVVSKPGYGIVSECIANGRRALHLSADGS
jgi:hypothetical protein